VFVYRANLNLEEVFLAIITLLSDVNSILSEEEANYFLLGVENIYLKEDTEFNLNIKIRLPLKT
jgi:hypothetical protein